MKIRILTFATLALAASPAAVRAQILTTSSAVATTQAAERQLQLDARIEAAASLRAARTPEQREAARSHLAQAGGALSASELRYERELRVYQSGLKEKASEMRAQVKSGTMTSEQMAVELTAYREAHHPKAPEPAAEPTTASKPAAAHAAEPAPASKPADKPSPARSSRNVSVNADANASSSSSAMARNGSASSQASAAASGSASATKRAPSSSAESPAPSSSDTKPASSASDKPTSPATSDKPAAPASSGKPARSRTAKESPDAGSSTGTARNPQR